MSNIDSGCLNVMTINSGSSSLKFAFYQGTKQESLILSGRLEGIGLSSGLFHVEEPEGNVLLRQKHALPDHDTAMQILMGWLKESKPAMDIHAVGHRIVHGADLYEEPTLIDARMLSNLGKIRFLAPDHLPHEVRAIEAIGKFQPRIPQIACFDTAFHRSMPPVAAIYALPIRIRTAGVKRYGFHGLSYEYIIEELRKEAGDTVAEGKVVIAHLGNGASMAAVMGGRSIETTMGFTPAGGLPMSSRCGDIDPGVFPFLLLEKRLSARAIEKLINEESGLLGLSGISADMKTLLNGEKESPDADMAVSFFCYQARKYLGALAAVLGGLDTLVFTGGIGENAPEIRSRICDGFSFLGINVSSRANESNEPVISAANSGVTVRVMKTNEELMIVRHTCRLLNKRP